MSKLEIGSRVTLKESSDHSALVNNPSSADELGTIKHIGDGDYAYIVEWDSGIENLYRESDLNLGDSSTKTFIEITAIGDVQMGDLVEVVNEEETGMMMTSSKDERTITRRRHAPPAGWGTNCYEVHEEWLTNGYVRIFREVESPETYDVTSLYDSSNPSEGIKVGDTLVRWAARRKHGKRQLVIKYGDSSQNVAVVKEDDVPHLAAALMEFF